MRLFVAVEPPEPLHATLSSLLGSLPGARWVAPENFHLTLRFIGEVPPLVADEIDCALQSLRGRRFELALCGTVILERGRATTLAIGVARDDRLDHLQSRIESALRRAGLSGERRRFQPHVSLARVDPVPGPALAGWVQAHNLLRTTPVPITRFTLFSSQPGPDQPVYTPEVDYELT